jgi:hypothetical protein
MTAQPGPVGEEAAKLIEALGEWARGAAAGAAGAHPDDDAGQGGISDGSPACRLCPLCQLIAVLRQARPETFSHLLDASAALTAALRSAVDHADSESRHRGVERIDLDPPPADGRRRASRA